MKDVYRITRKKEYGNAGYISTIAELQAALEGEFCDKEIGDSIEIEYIGQMSEEEINNLPDFEGY